jgi:hypothetical protein
MYVLVCGDRNYSDVEYLNKMLSHFQELFALHSLYEWTAIMEGEARGADTLARYWADSVGLPVEKFPALWDKHGKAAGPIRNQQMLDEGHPGLVIAFHKDIRSSKGTLDMVSRANKKQIPIILCGGQY